MLVEKVQPAAARDIDVLWVSNIRRVKRPDRILELAEGLPEVKIHMVGGPLSGEGSSFPGYPAGGRDQKATYRFMADCRTGRQ